MNQYQQPLQRPYGYPSPPSYYEHLRHRKPLRRWATIIGLGLLLNFAIVFLLGGIWAQFSSNLYEYGLSDGLVSLIEESVMLFIYVASLWPATLFIMAWIKIPPEIAFPLRKPRASLTLPGLFVCLGASMVGFLITSGLTSLIELAFGVYPLPPDYAPPVGIAANVVYVISLTLLPAVFEELLFRGVILQSLRRFGDGFALVVSAILFGLLHANLSQIITTTLMGMIFAYFVIRTGSLLPAMIFHFVNNSLSTVFTYVSYYMTDEQVQIMNLIMFAAYLLLGLVSLVLLMLRGAFRIAPAKYPLPASKKITAFFLSPAQIIFCAAVLFLTISLFTPV